MTAEEIKEEAHRIATSIFYSPATNGKAEPSINDGYNKIMAFAEAYANQWVKVEDGLPEIPEGENRSQECIIWTKGEYIERATYNVPDDKRRVAYWETYDERLGLHEVTHYMIINPPKP